MRNGGMVGEFTPPHQYETFWSFRGPHFPPKHLLEPPTNGHTPGRRGDGAAGRQSHSNGQSPACWVRMCSPLSLTDREHPHEV